jgi:hypothetical protein
MRRVVVYIDSLVLRGFRYEDRHAVSAGLREELTRVLAEPDAARHISQLASTSRLHIGNVNIGTKAKPQQAGLAAGNAVGRELIK